MLVGELFHVLVFPAFYKSWFPFPVVLSCCCYSGMDLTPGPCCVCRWLCVQGSVKLISSFSNLSWAQYAPIPWNHPDWAWPVSKTPTECFTNPTNQYWQRWESRKKCQVINSEHLLITATWKAPFPPTLDMMGWFLFCSKTSQHNPRLRKSLGTTVSGSLVPHWDWQGRGTLEVNLALKNAEFSHLYSH